MKKLTKILLLTSLFFTFSCSTVFATNWTIEVNGKKLDTKVIEVNDKTYIPLRAVGEALGLNVEYEKQFGEEYAILKSSNNNFDSSYIKLHAPGTGLEKNRYEGIIKSRTNEYKQYEIEAFAHTEMTTYYNLKDPIVERNGSFYVPVRLICDSFGAPLKINGSTISIGACFTAEENSWGKVRQSLDYKLPIPDFWIGTMLGGYIIPNNVTLKWNVDFLSYPEIASGEYETYGCELYSLNKGLKDIGFNEWSSWTHDKDDDAWLEKNIDKGDTDWIKKVYDKDPGEYSSGIDDQFISSYTYFKIRSYAIDRNNNIIYSDFSDILGITPPKEDTTYIRATNHGNTIE